MIAFFLLLASGLGVPAESPVTDRAWTVLKEGLEEKSAAKRADAVRALGLAGRSAQTMAEKALADPETQVRAEAATALLQMNALTAKPKLRECLKDPELQVVLACANALYEWKDESAYDIYYALLTGERRAHQGLVASQMAVLKDRKQLEKLAFETGIGFVPFGGAAWYAVKTAARDDASPIRAPAERLATDADVDTTKALTESVTDKKAQVRQAVVVSIARRGDRNLTNALETLLDDSNDAVKYDAAAAIISLANQTPPRRRK